MAGFAELADFEFVPFASVDFFALVAEPEDLAVLFGDTGAGLLAVDGFAAAVSPVALWRAAAAGTLVVIVSEHAAAQVATKPILRISAEILNEKTFASRKIVRARNCKNKRPNERWHCNHPRSRRTVPVPVGPFSVTEVYRPGKWCRPAESNPVPHQEHNILATLQARLDLSEFFLAVDRLLIHFEDYVAASQVHVVGKRTRLHILHDHAFALRQVQTVGHFRRHFAHRHAEFALLGGALVSVVLGVAEPTGKQFGAIGDDDRRILLLAVA